MMNEHIHYHIKIKSHLDTSWQDWFDGLTITLTDDGDTILSGVIVDQAALHGLLNKIRNLGLTIISINPRQKESNHRIHETMKKQCPPTDKRFNLMRFKRRSIEMNSDKFGETEMTNRNTDLSQRKAAIVAGGSILIVAIVAGFATFFVLDTLFVPGDAAATTNNIKASEMLFRTGLLGWLIILICDVLAAWGLYVFFKQVNKSVSLLTAWLRLVYTAILGVALLNFVIVLLLIKWC